MTTKKNKKKKKKIKKIKKQKKKTQNKKKDDKKADEKKDDKKKPEVKKPPELNNGKEVEKKQEDAPINAILGGNGYHLTVNLTSRGAGVRSVTLNRFKAADWKGLPTDKDLEL